MAAVADGQPTPYVAWRILGYAVGGWAQFDGWCAGRNVAPLGLPLDRFCNLFLFWRTQYMDSDERFRFQTELEIPPLNTVVSEEDLGVWSREAELAAFGLDLANLPPPPTGV